jgi:hypothetical protein
LPKGSRIERLDAMLAHMPEEKDAQRRRRRRRLLIIYWACTVRGGDRAMVAEWRLGGDRADARRFRSGSTERSG